jgi:hypothetical protein
MRAPRLLAHHPRHIRVHHLADLFEFLAVHLERLFHPIARFGRGGQHPVRPGRRLESHSVQRLVGPRVRGVPRRDSAWSRGRLRLLTLSYASAQPARL